MTLEYTLLRNLYKQNLISKIQSFSNEDVGQSYSETSIHTLLAHSTHYQALLSENFIKKSKMSTKNTQWIDISSIKQFVYIKHIKLLKAEYQVLKIKS